MVRGGDKINVEINTIGQGEEEVREYTIKWQGLEHKGTVKKSIVKKEGIKYNSNPVFKDLHSRITGCL